MFDVPVAFVIFNRPNTARRVLDVLRVVRPRRLFVIADGPRPAKPDDARLCEDARALIDTVDWPCEISRNFAPANLGCGVRIAGGLEWVFDQVESAIIIEDDCLPDPTFFPFCEQLLETYRAEDQVRMIGGTNPLSDWPAAEGSYFFSRHACHWGWASWARAWAKYRFHLDDPLLAGRVRASGISEEAAEYYLAMYDRIARGTLDAWDYQWMLGQLADGGFSVVPKTNLVSNIGFGDSATHTRQHIGLSARNPVVPMEFPLIAPPALRPDNAFDLAYANWTLGRPDVSILAAGIERDLASHHNATALLLARAGLAIYPGQPELAALQQRALSALRGHRN